MTWQSLLQAQRIKSHRTSQQELNDLRDVVERDMQDAGVEALSADRRFATAYNAVLQLAKMVIACSGYRVVGPRAGAQARVSERQVLTGAEIGLGEL